MCYLLEVKLSDKRKQLGETKSNPFTGVILSFTDYLPSTDG